MANELNAANAYPTGWFQISWSEELSVGDVKSLRYFGQDMVMFRRESGDVTVMDAYCLHLGAHLGVGGTVCGEAIQCPFHGWQWGPDGRNVDIPYADKPHASRQIRTWTTAESDGMIFLWYAPDGRDPDWQVPSVPEIASQEYYDFFPHSIKQWDAVRVAPQMAVENIADAAHFQFVHGAAAPATVETFEQDDHVFRISHRTVFGRGRKKTWLTPEGEVEAYVDVEAYGMGLIVARFRGTDGAVHISTQTPVDPLRTDMRTTMVVARDGDDGDRPTGTAEIRVKHQIAQAERDIPIWENMAYIRHAALVGPEARPYGTLRKWAAQFYEEGAEHGPVPELTVVVR